MGTGGIMSAISHASASMIKNLRRIIRDAQVSLFRGEHDGHYRWQEHGHAQRCVECDRASSRRFVRRPPVGIVYVGRRREESDGIVHLLSTGPLCALCAVQRELRKRGAA